jgi:hypothetical protein
MECMVSWPERQTVRHFLEKRTGLNRWLGLLEVGGSEAQGPGTLAHVEKDGSRPST